MGTSIMQAPSPLPVGLLARAVLQLSRTDMESLTQSLIERMDLIDGDPDLEPNGDEQDSDGDERDIAAPEWHTRHHLQRKAGYEMSGTGNGVFLMTEDDEEDDHDEEDDPSGQCDEDGVNTLHDRLRAYAGPGCVISDEDFAEEAPIAAYGIDQTRLLPNGGQYHA